MTQTRKNLDLAKELLNVRALVMKIFGFPGGNREPDRGGKGGSQGMREGTVAWTAMAFQRGEDSGRVKHLCTRSQSLWPCSLPVSALAHSDVFL